jgi:rubrerythrin
MKEWSSVDDVLDFAIANERKAVDFYTEMAGKAQSPHVKRMFEENANEERGHKAKLEAVKAGKKLLSAEKKVLDLKIGDYLVDVEAEADLDFQGALILAMKREKAAFRLYTDLAAQTEDAEVRELFLGLAQEEAKHKLRFEVEYDDEILKEN